jgi:ribosomal protein S18 acetylase RimI-like enzyme
VGSEEPEIEIRPLTAEDQDVFWALRLRAVTEHPEAFGWTPAEVLAASPEERGQWFVEDRGDDNVMLGAFLDGVLMGTLGLSRGGRAKMRHRASIRSVYVAPGARGRGIAARLLAEAIKRARSMAGVEVLDLSVGVANAPARRLYEGFGFEVYGVERWALKVGDGSVDEALMALRLVP